MAGKISDLAAAAALDGSELLEAVQAGGNVQTTAQDVADLAASDHGGLSGLGDDDHTQYSKADGTRAFTGTVAGVAPTTSAHLATKGYVDGLGLRLSEVVVYTSDSTWTKADYPGIKAVRVTAVGAGGGGGGCQATNTGEAAAGAGGGGGGTAVGLIDAASLSATETVTVGVGGSPSSGNSTASTGEDSSFGSHLSGAGGTGGVGGTAVTSSTRANSGSGGGWTGGDYGATGDDGDNSWIEAFGSTPSPIGYGFGGGSSLGGRRRMNLSGNGSNGADGSLYGGGGSGGYNRSGGQVNRTGGSGANGIVIVEIYI